MFLVAASDVTIEVSGHSDSTGSDAFNLTISQQRAQAVANYLIGQGIPATRLRVVGYGATRPVADNATAAGREMNRRVDLSFNLSQPLTDQFPSLSIGALTKIGRASCRERVGCAERDGG